MWCGPRPDTVSRLRQASEALLLSAFCRNMALRQRFMLGNREAWLRGESSDGARLWKFGHPGSQRLMVPQQDIVAPLLGSGRLEAQADGPLPCPEAAMMERAAWRAFDPLEVVPSVQAASLGARLEIVTESPRKFSPSDEGPQSTTELGKFCGRCFGGL